MIDEKFIVSPGQLRRTYSPEGMKPQPGDQEPSGEIIGQERAVTALRLGLGIQDCGFNIFVVGPPGIGKMTAVKQFLEKLSSEKQPPPDWCYVNNFEDPSQPRALRLPQGKGHQLQQDMFRFIDRLQSEVPKAFEGEEYLAKREEIQKEIERRREQIIAEINLSAQKAGYRLELTHTGVVMIPVRNEKPLSDEEFAALPQRDHEEYLKRRDVLQQELKQAMKQVREIERSAEKKIEETDKLVLVYVAGGFIDDLIESYVDLPEVVDYLKTVQKDVMENRELFKIRKAIAQNPLLATAPWIHEHPFRKYEVNVLVDNSKRKGAPLIVELNPGYNNLFGRLEKETQFGALHTDFTLIKAGSFHQANGGYLVMEVDDMLRSPFSWEAVKRTLRSGYIEMEDPVERLGYVSTRILRPQPIPIKMKVVLVGSSLFYYLLDFYDEDFAELFKVKADFDTRMPSNADNVKSYFSFLSTVCKKENLKELDAGARARILEHSARLAEDQEKLSTHFGIIADVVREAHYYASEESAEYVQSHHIRKAINEKIYRSSLIQERIRELMEMGIVLIDITGSVIGQVNGLSVIVMADYAFGRPNRITATVGPGPEGIVDIEREAKLGGPIHSKGILILSGYLSGKFAQDKPLTLSARLVFEQSYEGVEGDSASSTELYALLSALSETPIKQGIAVTGSVNQLGQVQAIGGVNQKIEGYFDFCKVKGLNGEQGVIIPSSNVRNLMLREDIVEAVQSKKFHIWAVKTIEEGIEILTGVAAGERGADGKYGERTVYGRIDRRLKEFIESLKEHLPRTVAIKSETR